METKKGGLRLNRLLRNGILHCGGLDQALLQHDALAMPIRTEHDGQHRAAERSLALGTEVEGPLLRY